MAQRAIHPAGRHSRHVGDDPPIMVANALYFNWVQHVPHWYTPPGVTTVVEVKYVMQTGLQLQPISVPNALPLACARAEATQKSP